MSKSRSDWVYIMASRKNGTLYMGVTADIRRRIWQHKTETVEGFTKQYGVTTLVHLEERSRLRDAINRGKEIKGWRRSRKIALIETTNPDWNDLAATWFERPLDPSLRSG